MLTEKEIVLVQDSFSKIVPVSEKAAETFYNRLFELDPSLKELFTTDLKEQGKKLMQMLASAVNGLRTPDKIIPAVIELGKRHKGYDVSLESYKIVEDALIYTLELGLGAAFTKDTEDAWRKVYKFLSETMIKASDYN